MARAFNTTAYAGPFTAEVVEAVWRKAQVIPGRDPAIIRQDCCGALIHRSAFGQQDAFGWEIDHEKPVVRGGSDVLDNLQPLHWRNNRCKGDSWPNWDAAIGDAPRKPKSEPNLRAKSDPNIRAKSDAALRPKSEANLRPKSEGALRVKTEPRLKTLRDPTPTGLDGQQGLPGLDVEFPHEEERREPRR